MVLEFQKNPKTFMAFNEKLNNIGVGVGTFYIAKEYKGPSKTVKYQLCLKDSIVSKKVLMFGENKEDLESLLSNIHNFPPCEDWQLIIRQKNSGVHTGYYMIIRQMKFTGTEGVENKIKNIVKELGGNKNDIDFILNSYEEKTFGYFPSNDSRMAEGYAKIIHTGATTPVKPEKWISFLEDMKKAAEYAVEHGDESAKNLAGAWDGALKLWREKLKQEDTEENIELKYINKYKGLVDEDYIEKLSKEYVEQDIIFEPLFPQFSDEDIDSLYSIIDNSKKLKPKQKVEAIFAVLSILSGSLPNETFIPHLEKIYPPGFIATLKEKMKYQKR